MPSMQRNDKGIPPRPGTLYVVATPIGNLEDITLRALHILRNVDLIAAEDTRHTRKLLSHFRIQKPLTSHHSHSGPHANRKILEVLHEGQDVALVTDAGTPGISDPGSLLIHQVVQEGFHAVSIPGPTALVAALVVSGLPTHPFAFLGFPPAKGSSRKRFFQEHSRLTMTLVLYESPQRLQRTLADIFQHWGNRRVAVVRELTKKFEEIKRGSVSEMLDHFPGGVRGELTLILEGAFPDAGKESLPGDAWEEELAALLADEGMTVRDAAEEMAKRLDLPRKEVYRKALEIRKSR